MKMNKTQLLRMFKDNEWSLFFLCIICGSIVWFTFTALTRGKYIYIVFPTDYHDMWMDYYNCIYDVYVGAYIPQWSSYPGFANLLFKIGKEMIPPELLGNISRYQYRFVTQAVLAFMVYNFFSVWLACSALSIGTQGVSRRERKGLIAAFVLSEPVLFALARGNIVLLAFAMAAVFVFCRHSKNIVVRELSYLCLAASAAIKLYPSILGLLLLKEKQYKEAIRAMVYGIVLFAVPFFAFDGIKSILIMIRAIFSVSSAAVDRGNGYTISLYAILNTWAGILGVSYSRYIHLFFLILICLILIVTVIMAKNEWITLASLTGLILFIPSYSYNYSAVFLWIPFISYMLFYYKKDDLNIFDNIVKYVVGALFLANFMMWVLPIIDRYANDIFPVGYGQLIYDTSLLILALFPSSIVLFDAVVGRGKYSIINNQERKNDE